MYDPVYEIPQKLMELLFKKDDWILGMKGRIIHIVREILKVQNKGKNEIIKNNIENFLNG